MEAKDSPAMTSSHISLLIGRKSPEFYEAEMQKAASGQEFADRQKLEIYNSEALPQPKGALLGCGVHLKMLMNAVSCAMR
jgi:hypothetical protein